MSFDAFRGLAILAVVGLHAFYFDIWDKNDTALGREIWFFIGYTQLLSFAVPAFLFISGYCLSRKPLESLKDYKDFLVKRLTRILVPYLLWSCILIACKGITAGNFDIQGAVRVLLTGQAALGYYFIIMIAQLYAITPVLQYMNRRRYGPIVVVVLNIVTLLALYYSRLYSASWRIPAALAFYTWFVFYEAGLLMGNRKDKTTLSPIAYALGILAMLLALILSVIECYQIYSNFDNSMFGFAAIKYSSFLYSGCVIFVFLCLRKRIANWPKLLVTIGNYSFGIYLLHAFVMKWVIRGVDHIDAVSKFQPLSQIVIVVASISICAAMIAITRKLPPKSFCSKVLGF